MIVVKEQIIKFFSIRYLQVCRLIFGLNVLISTLFSNAPILLLYQSSWPSSTFVTTACKLLLLLLLSVYDTGFEFRQGREILLFSKTYSSTVRATQLPFQWVPVFFRRGGGRAKRIGCEFDRLHLMPRIAVSRSLPQLPLCSSMVWTDTTVSFTFTCHYCYGVVPLLTVQKR